MLTEADDWAERFPDHDEDTNDTMATRWRTASRPLHRKRGPLFVTPCHGPSLSEADLIELNVAVHGLDWTLFFELVATLTSRLVAIGVPSRWWIRVSGCKENRQASWKPSLCWTLATWQVAPSRPDGPASKAHQSRLRPGKFQTSDTTKTLRGLWRRTSSKNSVQWCFQRVVVLRAAPRRSWHATRRLTLATGPGGKVRPGCLQRPACSLRDCQSPWGRTGGP